MYNLSLSLPLLFSSHQPPSSRRITSKSPCGDDGARGFFTVNCIPHLHEILCCKFPLFYLFILKKKSFYCLIVSKVTFPLSFVINIAGAFCKGIVNSFIAFTCFNTVLLVLSLIIQIHGGENVLHFPQSAKLHDMRVISFEHIHMYFLGKWDHCNLLPLCYLYWGKFLVQLLPLVCVRSKLTISATQNMMNTYYKAFGKGTWYMNTALGLHWHVMLLISTYDSILVALS